jgi:hypothetical protein
MAQVPLQVDPSVLPDRISDGYQRTEATPDAFGAQIGAATAGLGDKLGQAGDVANTVALSEADLRNQTILNSSFNALQQAGNIAAFGDPNDPNSRGYMSLQGRDAVLGYDAAAQGLADMRSKLASAMPSPVAANQFDSDSRRYVTSMLSDFGEHRVKEQGAWADQTTQAALQNDLSTAVLNRDNPDRFNSSLLDSQNSIIEMGQRNGWSADIINQKIQDNQSAVNLAVIKAKADEDPLDALKFYQQQRQHLTGLDQVEAENTLKPLVFSAQSSSDADNIMSGSVGVVSQAVSTEAQHQNVDPTLALTTAKIESGLGARPNNPTSNASGVFGMMPGTWQAQGGGNPNDVNEQVRVGVKNLADSQVAANDAVGGNAQPWQVYIVHQQGIAGGPALLTADPNVPAVDALTPAYKGNARAAAAAITANGGTADMTAGQFLTMWQQRYATAQASVETLPSVSGASSTPGSTLPPTIIGSGSSGLGQGAAAANTAGGLPPSVNQALAGPSGTYRAAVGPNAGTAQPLAGGKTAVAAAAPGVTPAAATAAPGVPTSNDPGAHLGDWLGQANGITDPLGGHDPRYAEMVASQIKAKTSAMQQVQTQADRANRDVLLSGVLGITSAATAPPPGSSASGPGVIAAGVGALAAANGAPAPRPTSLNQLLAVPAMKQAWIAASPETQRSILSQIEQNSKADAPATPAAQTTYYKLLSESTQDPATFLRENLADPDFLTAMPRSMVQELMNRQAGIDGKAVAQQQRQVLMTHARDVVMPDLEAAGISPRLAATNKAIAQTYSDFDGRLDEALQQFQKANDGQRPTDVQIKAIGQTLLTPGTLKGSGSLWGLLPNDTATRLFQAKTNGTTGQFQPSVPSTDRQQIIAAYGARHNGATPTDAEVQTYFMLGRQPAVPPSQPARTTILSPRQVPDPSLSAATPETTNAR